MCGSSEAIKLVTDALNSELKIKETGRITQTEGRIVFLGREIERQGEHLRMRVPPKYMETLFETDFCKDLKVLSSPPDLVKIIEKGRSDPGKEFLVGLLGGVSLVQIWLVGCRSCHKVNRSLQRVLNMR